MARNKPRGPLVGCMDALAAAGRAMVSMPPQIQRHAFDLGRAYKMLNGQHVLFVARHNEGTPHETVSCVHGVHRYSCTTREDMGRVAGSDHAFSDQRNVRPALYSRLSLGGKKNPQRRVS